MSPALVDAPVGRVLTLVAITHRDLADWLKRLGVFPGTILTRHDETARCWCIWTVVSGYLWLKCRRAVPGMLKP